MVPENPPEGAACHGALQDVVLVRIIEFTETYPACGYAFFVSEFP